MNTLRIFQKGWNFRQDGPGNRLVYHLQGCNLHCPWCTNPEGMSAEGSLVVKEAKLTPEVCPRGAVRDHSINRSICAGCVPKECVMLNFNEGIRLSCYSMSVAGIMDEVRGSKHLFHSGGGVTLSGGEPTLQFEPVKLLLEALKKEQVNTAVETNGTHPRLPELFPLIDTLIIDMKHYDKSRAAIFTGADNDTVLSNVNRAAESHGNLCLRITLVPGFNSSADDMNQFAALLRKLPQKHLSLELLAYHEYGKVKWQQCGLEYKMNGAAAEKDNRAEYEMLFHDAGINIVRT